MAGILDRLHQQRDHDIRTKGRCSLLIVTEADLRSLYGEIAPMLVKRMDYGAFLASARAGELRIYGLTVYIGRAAL